MQPQNLLTKYFLKPGIKNILMKLLGKLIAIISISFLFFGKVNAQVKGASIERYFTDFEIVKFDPNALYRQAKNNQNDFFNYDLSLHENFNWTLDLHVHDIFSENFKINTGGTSESKNNVEDLPIVLNGNTEKTKDQVIITVNMNFFVGQIQTRSGKIFIESAKKFDTSLNANDYIIYHEKNVISSADSKCASEELRSKSNDIRFQSLDQRDGVERRNGQCYGVDLAIANDYSMFQSHGTGLSSWNASVIANVNGDYSGSFADDIEFQISEIYISQSPNQDIWTSSNDASTLLSDFMNKSNQIFSGSFDLGELWTDKDLTYNGSGSTVGLAYVGEICGNAPFHVLEQINGASSLRNLVSHEIGHNFNLGHVSNSNYIMYGSVSGATEWDPVNSIPSINSYINSLSCLSTCDGSGPPPPPSGDAPVADFGGNILSGCGPVSVQFLDASTNSPTSWSWSFASGSPSKSTLQNPIVEFPSAGNYIVSLDASNAYGSSNKTYIVTIETAGNNPVASFNYSISGYTVDFSNSSEFGSQYSWNFGDGNGSTSVNPVHTFASAGSYTVSLTTTNDCGSDTYSTVITISDEIQALFQASQENICPGDVVEFTNLSTGNVESYSWTFEGGSPATSTAQNPTVTYNGTGNFNVSLTVSGGGNSDTRIASNLIKVNSKPDVTFTYTLTSFNISFQNNTTGGDTYEWDFGDGTYSTTKNPFHTYSAAGTYTVSLFSQNNCGNDIFTQEITVGNPVIAAFGADNIYPCTGSSVTFSNASQGDNLTYIWTFEGGTPSTSTDINPVVSYFTQGKFNVTLEVSDPDDNSDILTEVNYIEVYNHPEAEFNFEISNYLVNFQNISGAGESFFWTFGDGQQSFATNPEHTYAEAGIYEVTLTASNPCGESSITKLITIEEPLIADFEIENDIICEGNSAQFINTSKGDIASYSWIFEGGTPSISSDIDPIVTYDTPGTYPVQLTVIKASGEQDLYFLNEAIQVNPDAISNFDYTQDVLTFNFENLSENFTQLKWDFGDGNISYEVNPSHTYSEEGNYTVTLSVNNECSEDFFTSEIAAFDKLIANFKASVTDVCPDENFMLEDMSSGNPSEWTWIIEGNESATIEEQNPVIALHNPGSYNVTLTVRNPEEENTMSKEKYINVLKRTSANFTFEQIGDEFSFNNTDEVAESVLWNFGDGSTSTSNNPKHTYTKEGIYVVSLITSNQCGNSEFTREIIFEKELSVEAIIPTQSQCQGQEITILDASSDNVLEWEWQFPGAVNETSFDKNPKVMYDAPGQYSIYLKVKSLFDEKEISYENKIQILPTPEAAYEYSIKKDTVKFTNKSLNSTNYTWKFGELGVSSDENPTFIFPSEDTYSVILVSNNGCGDDTFIQEINLETESTFANFDISNQSYCLGDEVHFIDLSSADINSWKWEFPGGTPSTSNEKNPVISYNDNGNFDVKLTVSNGFNERTILLEDYINIQDQPIAALDIEQSGNKINAISTSSSFQTILWETGDGTKIEGEAIEYTYRKNGSFILKLTASNACGTDIISEDIIVNVYPEAGFSLDVTQGCSPLEVQFENRSSDNSTQIKWILEGSDVTSSSEDNLTALYETPGFYPVVIVASNDFGNDTLKVNNFIEVYESPEVDYDYAVNGQELTISTFVDNYDSINWDFGDGESSQDLIISHNYNEPGNYVIRLTVYKGTCEMVFEETIEIQSTGVEDIYNSGNILVYPNPVSELLHVKLMPTHNELKYEVVNVLGELLIQGKIDQGQTDFNVNVTNYHSGHYFIRLKSKEKIVAIEKFIVIH